MCRPMTDSERFHYPSLDALLARAGELGLELPVSDDFRVFAEPVRIGPRTAPNRLAVHPMEGCDSEPDGSPGELTRRRCLRQAAGGAGLIWMEACTVAPEGRASPRQMMLTEANADRFARLVEEMRCAARDVMGPAHEIVVLLQLTHAGRYSRPGERPAPILAHHSPELDAARKVPPDLPLITDEALDRLQDAYLHSARLAARVGMDGVDVKACHGYLVGGLLASFTRTGSRYGGEGFEDRTRMVREVHARIASELPGQIAACRLNMFDAMPYPYGWGVDRTDPSRPDLSEPLRLARILEGQGCPCINVTVGNPYYHAFYNRPLDATAAGEMQPTEHPLVGVDRMVRLARRLQEERPGLVVIGTGYSYLREFMPQVAAGVLKAGWAQMVGGGRLSLAYPDFARDLLQEGALDPRKVCIACSRCTQLMRDGMPSGCVVRDAEVYAPLYREGRARHRP
jgi:2,4-dienoyl-CoA reductase (NADPH2)